MKKHQFLTLAAAACVLALTGCPTSDSGTSDTGGTDSTASDTPVTGGDCAGVCAALMASHCFYGGGESDCNTSCNGWDSMYAAKSADCTAAWAGYKGCIVGATIPDCGGVATWNVMACRPLWDHTQNYCVYGMSPSQACLANAAFDAFCTAVAGKTHGFVCQGAVPADCVVGGNSNNADLYCCP